MNDHEDEALARLRRTDPAVGSHPDLHALTHRLRRRTPLGRGTDDRSTGSVEGNRAAGSAEGYPAAGSGGDRFEMGPAEAGFTFSGEGSRAVRVQESGVGRSRVGMTAAAAVVAAAIGVGGYALGLDNGRGDLETAVASAERKAASEAEQPSEELIEAYQELAAEQDDSALGDAAMGGVSAEGSWESASDVDMGWSMGPAVPVASEGLSEEGTTGEVLAMKAMEDDPADQVTEAAAALGIRGNVEADEHYAAIYDPVDGRSLNYYAYGSSGSLDYNNPALDAYCAEQGMGWFGQDGPTDLVCAEAAPAPSSAEAITITSEFAEQMGIDTAGLEFEVLDESYYLEDYALFGELEETDELEGTDGAEAASSPDLLGAGEEFLGSWLGDPGATGPQSVTVLVRDPASPAAGYLEWHLEVSSEGVVFATIPLTTFSSLGQYDVVSPAAAVDRIGDPRYNQVGLYIPDVEHSVPYWSEEWEEPPAVAPLDSGSPIPYPVTETTVTGAELHQGVLSLWDGTEYVVPTYNLTDGNGNEWQVLGLAEDALDFTP